MENIQLKKIVIDALEDIKAFDIIVVDVSNKSSFTDLLIIASGNSNRQINAIANNVIEKVKQNGVMPLSSEGESASGWILVDLGDIVVHIMIPETRDFYNIEKLWSDFSETNSKVAHSN